MTLDTSDYPFISVKNGFGFKRCQIIPEIRFNKSCADENITFSYLRKKPFFQGFISKPMNAFGPKCRKGQNNSHARISVAECFCNQAIFKNTHIPTRIDFRELNTCETKLRSFFPGIDWIFVAVFQLICQFFIKLAPGKFYSRLLNFFL